MVTGGGGDDDNQRNRILKKKWSSPGVTVFVLFCVLSDPVDFFFVDDAVECDGAFLCVCGRGQHENPGLSRGVRGESTPRFDNASANCFLPERFFLVHSRDVNPASPKAVP